MKTLKQTTYTLYFKEIIKNNFVFYSIFYFLFMFFDFFLVKTLTDFLGFNYKLSITFSTFIIFCLKFLVYDFIIFRKV